MIAVSPTVRALALALAWLPAALLPPAGSARLVVSPDGPYTTIAEALAAADPGDTIEVRGGTYPGPLVVDQPVQLEGVGWPTIDGGGQGTVVRLSAPGIVFRGFEVRGSGNEPDRDHSGITVQAPGVTVEGNRLEDVLFGIFVDGASRAVVRANQITGKLELDPGRRGDAIRLWYSQGSIVEDNLVDQARDVVLWYSSDLVVRNNRIQGGRYGIHLMYCDRARIEGNRVLDNSVGIYVMYSDSTLLSENLVRGQRGPSGYALGFKDADDVEAIRNVLVDNRVGVFLDGTPFTRGATSRFLENIFAFNDIGVLLTPAVEANRFEANAFWENTEQVAIQGGGQGENAWESNFWSDYGGFDANGDGVGEAAYQAMRLFEGLLDREPRLRAILHSPAVQAIEFAAASFPVVRPLPKLTDASPAVEPLPVPEFALGTTADPRGMGLAAGAVAVLAGAVAALALLPQRNRAARRGARYGTSEVSAPPDEVVLEVRNLSKAYGRSRVLDQISLEARRGEAIALWGPNGAGKTTLLKALLGLVEFQGEARIQGLDVARQGKAARAQVGYVPQNPIFHPWGVEETLRFYSRLRKADPSQIAHLVVRLGLEEHLGKPVPALSGGLKQRLALALALLGDPPVLLLDEPTASLDAEARRAYFVLAAGLREEGKTILFASHRPEEVLSLADRVMVLERGRLIEILSAGELRDRVSADRILALWVPADRLETALEALTTAGIEVHRNGRGTLVIRLQGEQKARPFGILHAADIPVLDFQIEEGGSWSRD